MRKGTGYSSEFGSRFQEIRICMREECNVKSTNTTQFLKEMEQLLTFPTPILSYDIEKSLTNNIGLLFYL